MRIVLLAAAFASCAVACMPGYYIDDANACILCPVGFVCDGSADRLPCESASMRGSAFCASPILCPTNVAAPRVIISPIAWTVAPNAAHHVMSNASTCKCATGPAAGIELDFGHPQQLGGLVSRSHSGWVQSYFVEYWDSVWVPLGGIYEWDSVWPMSTHELLFPYAVTAQKIRVRVIDYVSNYSYPVLEMAALSDPCCIAFDGMQCVLRNNTPVISPCASCCPEGFYSRDGGATCKPCPGGYVCANHTIIECDEGFYCPFGSTFMHTCDVY